MDAIGAKKFLLLLEILTLKLWKICLTITLAICRQGQTHVRAHFQKH